MARIKVGVTAHRRHKHIEKPLVERKLLLGEEHTKDKDKRTD